MGKETCFRVSQEWPWGSHMASLNFSVLASGHSASTYSVLCFLLPNLQTHCLPLDVLICCCVLERLCGLWRASWLSFDLGCKPCIRVERQQLLVPLSWFFHAAECGVHPRPATLEDLSWPLPPTPVLGRLAGEQLSPHHFRLEKESLFSWCDFLRVWLS